MSEADTLAMLATMQQMREGGSTEEEVQGWYVNHLAENSAYFGAQHIDFHFNVQP